MSYASLGSLLPLGQHWYYLLNEWSCIPNLITVEHKFLKGDFIEGQLIRPRLQVQFPYGSFYFAQKNEKKIQGHRLFSKAQPAVSWTYTLLSHERPQTVGGAGKFQFLLTSYHVVIFETDWPIRILLWLLCGERTVGVGVLEVERWARFLKLSRQEMTMALITHQVVTTVRSGYTRNRCFVFVFSSSIFSKHLALRGLARNLHSSAINMQNGGVCFELVSVRTLLQNMFLFL